MLTKFLILWISYFVAGSIAGVAPFIKPCEPLDSGCIVNSAKLALPYFAKGVEELGISALEPLPVKDVKADTGDLKVSFKNVVVYQLSQCNFVSITRDPAKLTASIEVQCPLILKGDYTFGGQLFYLDIEGHGPFVISGGTMRVSVDLKLKTFNDKQGKKHYKVGSFDYKFEPIEKYDLTFENLFNGDKVKAEPIEKIIKESWKELILDVGKPLLKEGILKVASVIDKMFKAVPADELEIA